MTNGPAGPGGWGSDVVFSPQSPHPSSELAEARCSWPYQNMDGRARAHKSSTRQAGSRNIQIGDMT